VRSFRKPNRTREITERELSVALTRGWSRTTSYDPARWSENNSAWGQCAVSALIVQDLWGGELLLGKINGIEHYWNRLSENKEIDFTRSQFDHIESLEGPMYVDRDYVLSFPATRRRYRQLRRSVLSHLKAWSNAVREPKVPARSPQLRQVS
jgi:hypothetical protein